MLSVRFSLKGIQSPNLLKIIDISTSPNDSCLCPTGLILLTMPQAKRNDLTYQNAIMLWYDIIYSNMIWYNILFAIFYDMMICMRNHFMINTSKKNMDTQFYTSSLQLNTLPQSRSHCELGFPTSVPQGPFRILARQVSKAPAVVQSPERRQNRTTPKDSKAEKCQENADVVKKGCEN